MVKYYYVMALALSLQIVDMLAGTKKVLSRQETYHAAILSSQVLII
jgi:hypothetical protein